MDVDLPIEFRDAYVEPLHGVAGTRRLVDRPEGVMLGTIVKPNIGLRPEDYRAIVTEVGAAGVDLIKDDEINADSPPAPLRERARVVGEALADVADRTGRKPLYALNITDEPDAMLRHLETAAAARINCIMVNGNIVGLPTVAMLRRHCDLPIHGHFAGGGALVRDPRIGYDFRFLQKLSRLAGIDQLHVGGFHSKMFVSDEETQRNVLDVLTPMLGGYRSLPVISSAQWAGTAPTAWELTHSQDLLVMAGGGMLGHPAGAAAGVRSMRQAWEASITGEPLESAAQRHQELRQALDYFAPVVDR
jgi:ribulose-bisphosphate carboxylase large chain